MKTIKDRILGLYRANVYRRVIIIWVAFQAVMWIVFAINYFYNPDAWMGVPETGYMDRGSGGCLKTFLAISGNNLILLLLIAGGNIFVRFGVFTPGLLILLVQGIVTGIVAGSNSFEFPFADVHEANIQYLKVGLWETTAYALACAVTLTKSLYIASTFPARRWAETRKLKEIKFDTPETIVAVTSILLLIVAAFVEAILLSGS